MKRSFAVVQQETAASDSSVFSGKALSKPPITENGTRDEPPENLLGKMHFYGAHRSLIYLDLVLLGEFGAGLATDEVKSLALPFKGGCRGQLGETHMGNGVFDHLIF